MKTSIIYFSGTGNTWYVAKSLNDILQQKGLESSVFSIEENEVKDRDSLLLMIAESDHIILGYPIYGSLAPKPMIDFIKALPKTYKDTHVSVFSTVALASGDGAIVYKKLLEDKGYRFHTGMEFKLSNNFNVPGFPDVLHVGNDQKIERRNYKALKKVEKMAEAIVGNRPKEEGDHVLGHLLGQTQRKHVDSMLQGFNEKLYCEDSKCVNCGKCAKICPVQNIENKDKGVSFKGNCAVCMRCYHFCPTQAINVTKDSLDTRKWPRYRGATKNYQKELMQVKNKNNL